MHPDWKFTDPNPEDVARRIIRVERERLDLSQADLADRLATLTAEWSDPVKIHPTAITRIERGIRGISLNEAVALASVLGLDLFELIGDHPYDDLARARQAAANRLLATIEAAGYTRTHPEAAS